LLSDSVASRGRSAGVTKLALLFFAKEKRGSEPLLAWPQYDFNPEERISELIKESDRWVELLGGDVVFTVKKWVKSHEDLRNVAEMSREFDGVVIYILTTSLNYKLFFSTVRELSKATVVFTEPYHSLAWPEISALVKEGRSILPVTSSDKSELIRAIKVLYSYVQLKRTKVLVVSTPSELSLEKLHQSEIYAGDRAYSEEYFKKIKEVLNLEFVDYRELLKKFSEVDESEARAIAKSLIDRAYWVRDGIEIGDVVNGVKLYLAAKKLIEEKGATAFTINDFTIMLEDLNALPATPCIAITLLNDQGVPAACEADLNSLILQIIFKYLAGRPAWINDPVFDFKDGSVTYAHCTAPTKMAGYSSEGEPYAIDIHDETGKPAAIRTKFKVGQVVTIAQISSDFKKLIIRRAEIADVPIIELACRTKVKTFAKNVEKMLWNYEAPLHRVMVYGDWIKELTYLARLMNLNVVFEE